MTTTFIERREPAESENPISYFRLFWTGYVQNQIMTETNKYAKEHQDQSWVDLSSQQHRITDLLLCSIVQNS